MSFGGDQRRRHDNLGGLQMNRRGQPGVTDLVGGTNRILDARNRVLGGEEGGDITDLVRNVGRHQQRMADVLTAPAPPDPRALPGLQFGSREAPGPFGGGAAAEGAAPYGPHGYRPGMVEAVAPPVRFAPSPNISMIRTGQALTPDEATEQYWETRRGWTDRQRWEYGMQLQREREQAPGYVPPPDPYAGIENRTIYAPGYRPGGRLHSWETFKPNFGAPPIDFGGSRRPPVPGDPGVSIKFGGGAAAPPPDPTALPGGRFYTGPTGQQGEWRAGQPAATTNARGGHAFLPGAYFSRDSNITDMMKIAAAGIAPYHPPPPPPDPQQPTTYISTLPRMDDYGWGLEGMRAGEPAHNRGRLIPGVYYSTNRKKVEPLPRSPWLRPQPHPVNWMDATAGKIDRLERLAKDPRGPLYLLAAGLITKAEYDQLTGRGGPRYEYRIGDPDLPFDFGGSRRPPIDLRRSGRGVF